MSSKRLSTRLRIYSGLASRAMKAAIHSRRARSGMGSIAEALPENLEPGFVWFHAASAGELETLWEPAQSWLQRGEGGLAISIFSPSAVRPLQKLRALSSTSPWLATGFSPLEGTWDFLFSRNRPKVFVTARYEAWPELWCALSRHRIPLIVAAAQLRGSLKVADRMTRVLGEETPELHFLTVRTEDEAALKKAFPKAQVLTVGDSRWERVHHRAEQGASQNGKQHPRVQAIAQAMKDLPRPWGIFGSAWMDDLRKWEPALQRLDGTVLIVPHDTSPASLEKMENLLSRNGFTCRRSSELGRDASPDSLGSEARAKEAVLVDEMGFLLELYSVGDWAYVGGGFGSGVHSTMEPAIFGLPVACGPKRAERFSEIAELQATGQLTLVRASKDILNWLSSLKKGQESRHWVTQAKERLGATQKMVSLISELAKRGLSAH